MYAATDVRPRGPREIELCESASHTDYLYFGGTLLAFGLSIAADPLVFKFKEQPGVRLMGPALIGLTWGWTLGGGYLSMPKCGADWVTAAPPEGDFRASWPLAAALGLLAGVTAPIIVGYETGPVPLDWAVWERSARVFVSAGTGVLGALLPYALPPKTWRAAKELQRIRAGADGASAFISYSVRF